MCTPPVSAGDILAGRYRVERVLGVGGMGVVVAAVHVQLGQRVAVKFLRSEISQHPGIGARFLREARAAARIQSEHVGRVIDFGTLDNGAPYMVMEFLSGADLSQLMHNSQRPSIEQAVEYILQACEGIAEAHALGVVHRDIKPANLFVTHRSDGSPLLKVLDFGISKAKDDDANLQPIVTMTTTGAVLGSPAYMSPEQVRNAKDIDGRADIWALGVVLYEMLAGHPVYQADTLSALLAMIAADPAQPLRGHRADVPPELERIVLRCLCKNRDERFADVGELALALKPFGPTRAAVHADRSRSVLGITGVPSLTDSGAAAVSAKLQVSGHGDSVPASVVSRIQDPSRSQLRRHANVIVAVAGLIAAASIGILLFNTSRKRQDPAVTVGSVGTNVPSSGARISSDLQQATAGVEPVVTPVASAAFVAAASSVASPPLVKLPPVELGESHRNSAPLQVASKSRDPAKRDQVSMPLVTRTSQPASSAAPTSPHPVAPAVDRGANPF